VQQGTARKRLYKIQKETARINGQNKRGYKRAYWQRKNNILEQFRFISVKNEKRYQGRLMDCKQFEKMLGKYMDGELGETSAEAMRSHMAQCAACAQEFAVLEKITKSFSQTEDEPLPLGFEQRWKQTIKDVPAKRKNTVFGKLLPALATGAAAVAVVVTILATGVFTPALLAPQNIALSGAQETRGTAAGGAAKSQASVADSAGSEQFAMMAPAPAAPVVPVASAESGASDASPQMKMAVQDSLAAIPFEVSPDTLDKLQNTFLAVDSIQIDFMRNGDHLTIAITDQNQKAVASIAEALGLDISPQTGETYDFYSAE
jgi:hypothetical protein